MKPVGPESYDERWLASAWGESGSEALFGDAAIVPRPRVRRALELAEFQPGQTVLDIACGRGEIPALAALAGAYAVGIDFSPVPLGVASKVREIRGLGERMMLLRADACRLPFADQSFDRITMLDIVEHLTPAQLDQMFAEVYRLLKPEGYAVIHTLPNRWVYDVTFPALRLLVRSLPADPRGPIEREVHINEQDPPMLSATLTRHRFQHRLWLEQLMPAQARWATRNRYGDNRDALYPTLAGPVGRLLEWLSATPLRLLLANDIFAVAWKSGRLLPRTAKRLALAEAVVLRLIRAFQQ